MNNLTKLASCDNLFEGEFPEHGSECLFIDEQKGGELE